MTFAPTRPAATTPRPLDVLVVDADDGLRGFLRVVLLLNLETALGATIEAATLEEALDAAADRAPDVVLVGVDGDDDAGMALLRAVAPHARVIAYSTLRRSAPSWADACITRGDVIAVAPLIEALRR